MTSDQTGKDQLVKKNGVVVLIDRLGTKGEFQRRSKTLDTWKKCIRVMQHKIEQDLSQHTVKFRIFSDTIIITVYGETKDELLRDVGTALMGVMAYCIKSRIYLRGSINYGGIIESGEVIVGQALDEVSEYYSIHQWVGISTAPGAWKIVDSMSDNENTVICNLEPGQKLRHYGVTPYVRHNIPLTDGGVETSGWVINWPKFERISQTYNEEPVGSLELHVKECLNEAMTVSHVLKWRNTKAFYWRINDCVG